MAVDFGLSVDQQAIAESFGAFFTNECGTDVVRDSEPLGHSHELWTAVRQLDAPGLAAPEANGGSGATLSQLIVIAEAAGSHLAPIPLIEHWLAAAAVGSAELVSGAQVSTLALRPVDDDGVWRVVPAGAVADVVVGIDGSEVVAVEAPPPGIALTNHGAMPLADRSARAGQRTVLGPAADFQEVLDRWRTLTAAALTGLAQQALRIGQDYVLERKQFGRRIGEYQAIKHGLADMPALIDGARFLTHKAAWAADADFTQGNGALDLNEGLIERFEPLAAMAFVQAADAAAVTTDRSLHYHGGYGFSAEYDIQLYFRRARSWAAILGDRAGERLRLADLLWGATA